MVLAGPSLRDIATSLRVALRFRRRDPWRVVLLLAAVRAWVASIPRFTLRSDDDVTD
jgi:hypothetical protein